MHSHRVDSQVIRTYPCDDGAYQKETDPGDLTVGDGALCQSPDLRRAFHRDLIFFADAVWDIDEYIFPECNAYDEDHGCRQSYHRRERGSLYPEGREAQMAFDQQVIE